MPNFYPVSQTLRTLGGLFCLGLLLITPYVCAQELDESPILQGKVRSNAPTQPEEPPQRMILKGSVQTLEAAIESESKTVDWYGWYLRARAYISAMGGLGTCQVGTLLTFHKSGNVQAQTLDPRCMMTVDRLHFALPKNTQLEAVTLPVRSGKLPPAPPDEIYKRTKGFQ